MRELITYLVLAIIGFYVFPMFCDQEIVARYFLTSVNPIIVFICSYCYGSVRPYGWWFPLLIAVIFVPALFTYYDPSLWYYVMGYAGISMLASVISWYFFKKQKQAEVEEKMAQRKPKK